MLISEGKLGRLGGFFSGGQPLHPPFSVTAQSQAIASISLRPPSGLSNSPPHQRNVSTKMEAAACGKGTPCVHPVWRPALNNTPVSDSTDSRSRPWGPDSCQWVGRPSVSALLVSGVRAEVRSLAFLAMGVWKSPVNLGWRVYHFFRRTSRADAWWFPGG